MRDATISRYSIGWVTENVGSSGCASGELCSAADAASVGGEQQQLIEGGQEDEDADVLSAGSMSRTQSAELQEGGDEEQQGQRRPNSGALARIIKRYSSGCLVQNT